MFAASARAYSASAASPPSASSSWSSRESSSARTNLQNLSKPTSRLVFILPDTRVVGNAAMGATAALSDLDQGVSTTSPGGLLVHTRRRRDGPEETRDHVDRRARGARGRDPAHA